MNKTINTGTYFPETWPLKEVYTIEKSSVISMNPLLPQILIATNAR